MIKKQHKQKEHYLFRNYDLLAVFLFGLIPFLWFKSGCVIAAGDFSLFLNPSLYSSHYLQPWARVWLGFSNVFTSILIPYYGYFKILQILGVGSVVAQKIWMVFFFMLPGLSMRYFVKTIFAAEKYDTRVPALASSLFYMFNFFVLNTKVTLINTNGLYACAPLFMGLVFQLVKTCKIKYAILIALSSLLCSAGAVNPPALMVFLLIQFIFMLFTVACVLKDRMHLMKSIFHVLCALIFTACINAWWLLPFMQLLLRYQGFETFVPIYWNPGATLKDTFVLGGSWAWGDYYYPLLYPIYQQLWLKYLMYMIPCMVFGVVLYKSPYNWCKYFFLCLSFFGIFISKGRGGMGGNVFAYLFDHLPFFWMFREPYAKFSMITALGYSVLIGMFAHALFQYAAVRLERMKNFVPVLCCVCILGSAWPFFSTYFLQQSLNEQSSVFARVPKYWEDAAHFVNKQLWDTRLFEMPDNKGSYTAMHWKEGFSGAAPEQCFFDKPVLTGSTYDASIIQYVYYLMETPLRFFHPRLFNLLSVQYIYQRNDVAWQMLRTWSPVQVATFLRQVLYLKKEATFGSLDFYRVQDNACLVYLKDSLDLIVGGYQTLPLISYDSSILDYPAVIFFGQTATHDVLKMLPHIRKIVISEPQTDSWLLRLHPEKCKVQLENGLAWKNNDYVKGWTIRSNFYTGEWVSREDLVYVNGDAFEGSGAIFTQSDAPFVFSWLAPEDNEYMIYVRSYVAKEYGGMEIEVDGKNIAIQSKKLDDPALVWSSISYTLKKGPHVFRLKNNGGKALVDSVLFSSAEDQKAALSSANMITENKEAVYLWQFDNGKRSEHAFRVYHAGLFCLSVLPINGVSISAQKLSIMIDNVPFDGMYDKRSTCIMGDIALSEGMHTVKGITELSPIIVKLNQRVKKHEEGNYAMSHKWYGSSRLVIDPCEINDSRILVFNEKFHQGWKAYIVPASEQYFTGVMSFLNVFKNRLGYEEIPEHIMVNGYANAYYLPKAGKYAILLEFNQQNTYEVGVCIMMLCALLWFGLWLGKISLDKEIK